MRVSEWILVGYLAYLLAMLPFRTIPRANRLGLAILAPLMAAVVVWVSALPPSPLVSLVRTWLPLPYILVCYWLTGLYFVNPQERFERSFVEFDGRVRSWLGAGDFARSAPRAVLEFLEVSYASCYLTLPAGLVAFILVGQEGAADRYWSIVLLAELACYGVLPWIRTRPPWILNPGSPLSARHVLVRRLNLEIVRESSTRANTFPSGHAAGAVATALAVAQVWPLAGAVFFAVALSIMAGSVAGEYHYAGDAVTGAATAVAAWGLVLLIGV